MSTIEQRALGLLDESRLLLEKSQDMLAKILANPPVDMPQEIIDKLTQAYEDNERGLNHLQTVLDTE